MTRYMTERDLLAMRTGWPAFAGDPLDNFGYDRAEILRRLRYLIPAYSFREVSQYSNPGYFVAGEVAARAAGLSWNDLVASRIFAPLKMTRSGTSVKDLQDSNATAAHAIVDGKVVIVEPSNQDTMGAAGSVTSTASDLVKYMLMYLNKGTFEGTQVLKPDSVAEMYKRSMVGERSFTELPPISDTTGFYYGLGFDSYDYAGHHIIAKPGALAGVRTIIVMVPDLNAGIIVLANLNVTTFPEAVRAYFLNQLLHIDVNTDQEEILAVNKQLSHLLDEPTPPVNPGTFPWPLQSLVGVYENELYGRCEITVDGQAIKAVCGPGKYTATLIHWDDGLFLWKFPDATRGYAQVIFSIGADATADSFTHSGLGPFTRVTQSQ